MPNGEIVIYALTLVQQLWFCMGDGFVWNAFAAVMEDVRVLRRLLQADAHMVFLCIFPRALALDSWFMGQKKSQRS